MAQSAYGAILITAILFVSSHRLGAERPTLRVGAYFSLTGAGATTNNPEAWNGLKLVVNTLNSQNLGRFQIDLILCDDQFNVVIARKCWERFAVVDPVPLVIGGDTTFTVEAANYFETFGILNLQCCTGPNAVYASPQRQWLFGVHRPSDDYPKGILDAWRRFTGAVVGGEGTSADPPSGAAGGGRATAAVGIVYSDASLFTVSTAQSAADFAKDLGLAVHTSAYNGTGWAPSRSPGAPRTPLPGPASPAPPAHRASLLNPRAAGCRGRDTARQSERERKRERARVPTA